ncbi:hypothetical protein [Ralstonia mannitolilytica]|uniref:hypothetical protein n=1 Tax=Ralstonia mannitolilytica TaxID=105219 RepID=UPI002930486B|nr:hypothetical protein [Ralstonia mannitolilytica]
MLRLSSFEGAVMRAWKYVVLLVSFVACLWSASAGAAVYGGGSMGATSWAYERMMNNIVRTVPGGVMVGGDGVARIGYAGKQIGTVAMTEASVIGLGDIAAVVARSVNPAIIALTVGMFAVEMAYKRCNDSATGWCKRAPANGSSGDSGFDGHVWRMGTVYGDSPVAACRSYASAAYPGMSVTGYDDSLGGCTTTWPGHCDGTCYMFPSRESSCVSGYTMSGGKCVVDASQPANWLPASYPDVAAAWNRSAAMNPDGIPDFWKQMTPEEQAQASANAQAQPTKINGSDTVSDPAVETSTQTKTKPDGTTEECKTTKSVTVQARPNTGDGAKESPLNYKTTTATTTVCPDGTTTTTTDQDTGNTGSGGGNKEDPKPDPVTDTPLGDLPKLYESRYPDGMVGVWKASKPNVQTTPFFQAIASMFPSFGGGTCPAFSLNLNVMPHGMFGVRTIDVSCSVFQVVGLIMLATAAFTARKILF